MVRNEPRIVAHRYGNSKRLLQRVLQNPHVDEIECDVWLRDGNLVVRHNKRIWWFPFTVERWRRGLAIRSLMQELSLEDVIAMTSESTKCLVVDVKGVADRNVSIHQLVSSLLNVLPLKRACAVHSKNIVLLETIRREAQAKNARCPKLFYSIGETKTVLINPFKSHLRFLTGVSVKKSNVDVEAMRALKHLGFQVYIWTIRSKKEFERTREELPWVDGIITDWIPA